MQGAPPSPADDDDDDDDDEDDGEGDDDDDDDEGGDGADDLSTKLLTLERVEYVEKQYGLPGTGTYDERAKAVIKELGARKAELRKQQNGKVSKDATKRLRMQAAWRWIGKYDQKGAGDQWRTPNPNPNPNQLPLTLPLTR